MHIKNFKTALLVIVLLSAIAESSIAADWLQVINRVDESVFVDMQSLRRTDSKVKVWEKWVFSSDQKIEGVKKSFRSAKLFKAYRCAEGTAILLEANMYADNDAMAIIFRSESHPDTPSGYKKIPPGSAEEVIFTQVCKASESKGR
jgi:hypothetical protein